MINKEVYATREYPKIRKIIIRAISSFSLNNKLQDMLEYQLSIIGKGIRPRIIMGLAELFDNKSEDFLLFAASVELLHNASLVHDDIQDKDVMRRDKETAWKKFSVEQAINLGDALFALAFRIIDFIGEKRRAHICSLISRYVLETVDGQTLEIAKSGKISLEDYHRIVRGKTSSLFILSLEGAFYLAGKENNNSSKIGSSLGLMFQIRDDILEEKGLKEGRSKSVQGLSIIRTVEKIDMDQAYGLYSKQAKELKETIKGKEIEDFIISLLEEMMLP